MQSYTYDSDGNVISTADYANQQSTYSYNNSLLSNLLNPDGTSYEYSYDDKNNLVASRSNMGIQSDIKYDSQGNPISTVVGANNYSATIQDGKTYYIRLKGSGRYLAVENSGTANNTNVCQETFTGANNQKWRIEKAVNGGYYILPQNASGMGLDITNGSDSQDSNVAIHTHNTSETQRFDINPQSDYTYTVAPKCSSDGKIVTVPNAATYDNVAIWTPQGKLNANQSWYFEDVSTKPVTQIEYGAVYQLMARHSGRYVSVSGGATSVGARTEQLAQGYYDYQKFVVKKYANTDYYTLAPVNAPDKLLTATTISTDYDCEYIELGDSIINDSKLFKFVYDAKRNAYKICPKSSLDKCFAVAFSYCTDSASVVISADKDTDNRYFMLEKISDVITSSATYQDNGNYPHTVTDSRGNTTTYTYDTARGLQTGITDAVGNTTKYSYNSQNDRLQSVSIGNSSVNYTYETGGSLKSITSPSGTVYNFKYDEFGNTSKILVGSKTLTQNTYDATRGLLTNSTYGNGQKIGYTYDILDRITQKLYNDVVKVKYKYDKFGNLYEKQDLFINTTYNYSYDLIGRITKISGSDGTSVNYAYDNYNRISKQLSKIQNESLLTEYIYGDSSIAGQYDGIIYGVKQNGQNSILYSYDELARLNTRTLNTTAPFVTSYGYLQGAKDGTATTLVKTVTNGNDTFEYTYDSLGNITSIAKNGTVYESYTYDKLNQLKTVTRGNAVYEYAYDNGGNIQSVKLDGKVIKDYTYGDSNWKDLLTEYNGQNITYDQIGNPLTYRDGFNFTWSNGRQLTGITQNGNNISYLYNADGLRSQKTVNGITTDYYYLNGVLQAQKTGDEYIIYLYDENGSAYGMILKNGATEQYYYYLFNAQGDVIGIIDQNGTQVVTYEYSSWGELLSVTGAMADTLGKQNPIRYRGYYHDNETGFYLTGTRYYDPEIGRFINADGYVSTGQGVLGNNMFAYCGNNPVNRADPTGMFWKEIGDFFSKAWNGIKTWAKNTFGAGSSTTATIAEIETPVIPDPSPVTVKTGTKTTQTISKHGDSSKPISVYANKDAQHPIKSSSAGININIVNFTLDLSVGLDDIGISGSLTNGNTTNSFGVKLNLSELKIGFEGSTAIQWDNTTETALTNASISGWAIAAAYILATTGQYVQSPSYAY